MNPVENLFSPSLERHKTNPDPIAASLKKNLQVACDALLDPKSESHIDYEERKSEFWTTRSGGRVLSKAIETLAFGGILLDKRYAVEARNILETIVEHRIVENCGGTNYGKPYRTWRDNCLDAGVSSLNLAIGLDLLRPSFSPEEQARFGTYLIPFIDYTLNDPPDPEEKRPDSNMAAIGLFGLGLLSMVLRSMDILDDDRFSRAMKLSKRRCILFLEKGHDGDGAFYEGPAYGGATVHFMAPFVLALARCGDREVVDHEAWQLFVHGLVHELIPSTGRPNILNDCTDQFHVEWLALVAAEQKSGLAQWLWQSIDKPPSDGSLWQAPDYAWGDTVTRYLLYYDPSIAPIPPETSDIPKKKHFRNRGLVDIRSGWKQDDFFLSFLCDVFPAGGHRQADRNQFALHALGESFAIDSGYALEPLSGTTEVLRLGALGEAHNLPLVHGEMQHRGQVTEDGIRHLDLDTDFPYIESEAGQSYNCATRFTRRVLCLPGEDGAPQALIVSDRFLFHNLERALLSWLLHTHPENQVERQRTRFTLIGAKQGNRCDVQIVTPWPGRWKEETFFDHPRLRYDWFWDPLFCIVALVPYRAGEPAPEIVTQGSADGCALAIHWGNTTDTILTAGPEKTVEFQNIRTSAEFAHVRTRKNTVLTHRISGGNDLTVNEKQLASS